MKPYEIRVLPLEPTAQGFSVTPPLPLVALDGIERAALALVEAVRLARGHSVAPLSSHALTSPHTVVDVCNEFLFAKARAGRSDNYLRVTLSQLKALCAALAHVPVAEVTSAALERWLYDRGEWSEHTRANHLQTVRTLLEFAIARGYVVGNAALGVDMPIIPNEPPAIHAPEIAAEILEIARRQDLNVCRWLAVRYFAGLRASEASSLTEECIHPARGFIEVTAAKAKTRRRRIVDIQPNLAAWLELGGRLPLGDVNTKVRRLTSALPVAFERNATRHSFCSYHLAEFGSASRTALQAGHTEQMLFNHYRECVTREAARAYWNILPKSEGEDSGGQNKVPRIES